MHISSRPIVSAFGCAAPFVVAFVVARTGNNLALALYVIAGAVVTAAVLAAMSETGRRALPATREGLDTAR